nr:alpha-2,8-sialyltransferase 8E-like [Nerophis lumbriciformis]
MRKKYLFIKPTCVSVLVIIILWDNLLKRYNKNWTKNDDNHQNFTSELSAACHGFEKAIVTQANTPVGSRFEYDGDNSSLRVTPKMFKTFIKEHPFSKEKFATCAVVGSGGILIHSKCGKTIDSADFVFRCNLPPLNDEYGPDVGVRTDLVTANPSIFEKKYEFLTAQRENFVEALQSYGKALVFMPAFSYSQYTALSMWAVNTMEEFDSPTRAVFFNPEYLRNLIQFWRDKGLRSIRPSTGFLVVSLALEVCSEVHLYGFWPYSTPPYGRHTLTNHYYDDVKVNATAHAMPVEFDLLLDKHSQGVLKLQLEDCPADRK